MEILSDNQHRALAFVEAANKGGLEPTEPQVDVWLKQPLPRRQGWGSAISAQYAASVKDRLRGPAEYTQSTVGHLRYLGWVTKGRDGQLSVTQLGQALLRSAEADHLPVAPVVVLDSKDPLSYPVLIGELAAIGEATLVDPYLDLQGLVDVLSRTKITKILVSNVRRGAERHHAGMATYLGGREPRYVEVRASGELHDRLVVASDRRIWTIGASLNTVAKRKSITVMTPLPKAAADVMFNQIEHLWCCAVPLVSDLTTPEAALADSPSPSASSAVEACQFSPG